MRHLWHISYKIGETTRYYRVAMFQSLQFPKEKVLNVPKTDPPTNIFLEVSWMEMVLNDQRTNQVIFLRKSIFIGSYIGPMW